MEPKSPSGVQTGVNGTIAAERELVAAIRTGDRQAFDRLAEQNAPRLFRAACRLCGDPAEAEELAQETLVKGFLSATRFRGQAAFYTWLYRILLNLWKNRLRTRSRWKWLRIGSGGKREEPGTIDADRLPASDPDPLDRMERRERRDWVRDGLQRLDPRWRKILVLREAEGLDYSEIAAVLGGPVGTVRSRLARARTKLRQILVGTADRAGE